MELMTWLRFCLESSAGEPVVADADESAGDATVDIGSMTPLPPDAVAFCERFIANVEFSVLRLEEL